MSSQSGQPPTESPRHNAWGDESEAVHQAVDWATSRVARASDPKSTARASEDLTAAIGPTVTPSGIGAPEAMRIFTEILEPATRAQDDPMNLAYIPSAPTRAAVAFDLVTSAANIYGGLWEGGAGAIWAENQALDWLIGLLGWGEHAAGCFVSGGTVGNLSALSAARHRALTRRGAKPSAGWVVACSQGAHSSVGAAARILDVEVVEVPEDESGHLTAAALRESVTEPDRLFAVVASAGTTNAGVIDELDAIASYCAEVGAWLHVDGAYGGAGIASPRLRPLYAGIERADSFIVDPHKWLFAPYDSCALLYQDARAASAAHSQHASYLDTVDRTAPNPSDLAIHLSRRARGLPLWFSLATHGADRYAAAIDRTFDTAHEVARAIEAMPHLRLLHAPELTVILFDRPGWDAAALRRWSEAMAKSGQILCIPTSWHGEPVLRLAFVNPATDPRAVIELLATTLASESYPVPPTAGTDPSS